MDNPTILILGATGLFGGHLAKRLIKENRFNCIFAGRTESTLKLFCLEHGGSYRIIDRNDHSQVRSTLSELLPFAVVDCAGPYQAYGDDPYHFARLAIEAGCHYLDIADAGKFVAGFKTLDTLAKEKNVAALSGASSTPAISSVVLDVLTEDMEEVISINTAILPGNRARRTLSVMQSILSQVGQRMTITRHGQEETVLCWGETEAFDLNVEGKRTIKGRLGSLVNTPDIHLFADRYQAQTVTFKAGLEVKFFHYALSFGCFLVSSGVIKSLEPMSKLLRWVASWFEWVGSAEGGMKVSVLGKMKDKTYLRREWDLIADDGHGPKIPTLPVSIMLNKLLDDDVPSGARACLGEFSLAEVEAELQKFDGKTQIHLSKVHTVFSQGLGEAFDRLPEPVKSLHGNIGKTIYEGSAEVKGASGIDGKFAAWLVGFPSSAEDIPVRVTITADEKHECWVREFGDKTFRSFMSVDGDGFVQERFGPLHMRLGLKLEAEKLLYPVIRGRLFGVIPVPRFLLPVSIAHERQDEDGRFLFDVLLKTPFGSRIAHYKGWLVKQ